MRLSIIIPAYNNDATLPRVLAALRVQLQRGDEVLVIDDGSRDQSAARAREAGGVFGTQLRVISVPHRGAAAARNDGIRAATNELLLFLGADILPGPTLLQRHRAVHARFLKETIGCLGHITWDRNLPPTPFMVWLEQGTQNAYGALAGMSWVNPRRYAYGAHLSLKRSLAIQAGGYDAEHFPGYGWEDVEFGMRLFTLGFRLFYEPTARAAHVHPHTVHSFVARQRAVGRAFVTLARLHPSSITAPRVISRKRWRARRLLYPLPFRRLIQWYATYVSQRWIFPWIYGVVCGWAFTDGVQEQSGASKATVESLPPQNMPPGKTVQDLFSSSGSQKLSGARTGHQKVSAHHPHAIHRVVHKG